MSFEAVELQNTILARNTTDLGAQDCSGPVTSLGHNLVGNPVDCTITLLASDHTGNPGLGTFRNDLKAADNSPEGNGHIPLLAGSPAIDGGDPATCRLSDQLVFPRADGDLNGSIVCDIGAVEFTPIVNALVTLNSVTQSFDETPVIGGFAGSLTIVTEFTNTSSRPIALPFFQVQTLTGSFNTLLNADDGPGGVGSRLTPDVGSDRVWSPGEVITVTFEIGLNIRRPFTFLVDLMGYPQ